MTKKIVTFGEIMGRIMLNGASRFKQALPGPVSIIFAGAEANVAVSISLLGGNSSFVSALPNNDLSWACIANLKAMGVDTRSIILAPQGRLGLYFTETGANQRPSRVIYDRGYSAISQTSSETYMWDSVFEGAAWFHTTGITPSLSKCAAEAAIDAVKKAKAKGLTVSCDLNYRSKLWRWDPSLQPKELAYETMNKILPYVDVLIANEEDAASVLNIQAANTDVHAGKLDVYCYEEVASKIGNVFANIKLVATTFRQSISASHNNWGGMLYDCKTAKAYYAPLLDGEYRPYEITHIVDRVGGGDSFAAALIFALNDNDLNTNEKAIAFAAAASCLAHSIPGDFNFHTREEVENLMQNGGSGRVVR